MKKRATILCVIGAALHLSGCAMPAGVSEMVYVPDQSQKASSTSPYFKKVMVGSVNGGSETNPLFTGSQVSADDFKSALSQSLNNADYLSAGQTSPYTLNAEIIALDQPLVGINMTVRTTIDYSLKESNSNKVVFKKTVETPFTATMSDAFVGINRLKIANEGSVKRNIMKLLEELNGSASPSKS